AEQTGVKRDLAGKERNAKIDIAEHTIARIGQRTVRRVAKQRRRHGAKALDRGNPERFLGVEVMKEAAFGDPGGGANVIDRAAGIALGPYDVAGRIEQLAAGFGSCLCSSHFHTNQLVLSNSLTFSASQARGSGTLARGEAAGPVNTEREIFRLILVDNCPCSSYIYSRTSPNRRCCGRQAAARGECGARGRICNPLPGGFGHPPDRHYDRSARSFAVLRRVGLRITPAYGPHPR